MNTPIFDFVTEYNNKNAVRLHMPGHKGVDTRLGIEHMDITEFEGADELWDATGIIAESEANASSLFGCKTFYSAEGSSLCIRAMMFLIKKWALLNNYEPLILAGRNAHRTFVYSASVLDIDIDWIMSKETDSYQMCSVTADDIVSYLDDQSKPKPVAVYLTSPDYLGNCIDISSIAGVCHDNGILLVVDNAHGAYLKFMNSPVYPIDLGADLCCDSAHKTLPALTGAAYLHISDSADSFFIDNARFAMALFGSTSPSYLILQSLDLCNEYLDSNPGIFDITAQKVKKLKSALSDRGFKLCGSEPLKVTIDASEYGYSGFELSKVLEGNNIYDEYHDTDYVVLMYSPSSSDTDYSVVLDSLSDLPQKPSRAKSQPCVFVPEKAISFNKAIFSESEIIPAGQAKGRILSDPVISTPPCVPIYMCGEVIDTIPPVENVSVVKELND